MDRNLLAKLLDLRLSTSASAKSRAKRSRVARLESLESRHLLAAAIDAAPALTPLSIVTSITNGDEVAAVFHETSFNGSRSFATQSTPATVYGNEFIPVDVSRSYKFSAEVRGGNGLGGFYDPTARHYLGFASYDVDCF